MLVQCQWARQQLVGGAPSGRSPASGPAAPRPQLYWRPSTLRWPGCSGRELLEWLRADGSQILLRSSQKVRSRRVGPCDAGLIRLARQVLPAPVARSVGGGCRWHRCQARLLSFMKARSGFRRDRSGRREGWPGPNAVHSGPGGPGSLVGDGVGAVGTAAWEGGGTQGRRH